MFPANSPVRNSGKVAVMVAVMLPTALIPILAIGVDGGNLMNDQREVQSAVDAAALQAATRLFIDNPDHVGNTKPVPQTSNALAEAIARLEDHGMMSDNCKVRTVNIPATSTNERVDGAPGTVEVEVQYQQARYFSRIWGGDDLIVTARSVARVRNFSQGVGILVLEEHDNKAFYGRGSGKLLVKDGNVTVNSDGATAAQTDGTTVVLGATGFDVTGGYTGEGYYLTPYPTAGPATPFTGSVPVPDPLRDLPEPSPSTLIPQTAPANEGPRDSTIELEPGYYSDRLFYDGPRNIFLKPGLYYLEEGIGFQGQVSVYGEGVTLFSAGSGDNNINIGGSGAWNLTAPTSGTYEGIVIFQSRNTADPETTSIIRGNGEAGLTGIVYTPTTKTTLTGGGEQYLEARFITRTFEINGSGTFIIDYPATKPDRLPSIELVE
ncbi:pilus assembly protein TadG-related protein [Bremerella sp. P1]|uniref:pilus assembly protein TadG-related protein n=1 Tax=Bremerella sp. P1 TaxID=3026424 RepID=UPI002367D078|nr:pilus assembly protein TadG-related protein [Bremerella sp. P1]WDI42134.1 pilus assembly protein TadG-related protein [Bremerella sp. P1]